MVNNQKLLIGINALPPLSLNEIVCIQPGLYVLNAEAFLSKNMI